MAIHSLGDRVIACAVLDTGAVGSRCAHVRRASDRAEAHEPQRRNGAGEREVVLPSLQGLKPLRLDRRYNTLEVCYGVVIRTAERQVPSPYHVFGEPALRHSLCSFQRGSLTYT